MSSTASSLLLTIAAITPILCKTFDAECYGDLDKYYSAFYFFIKFAQFLKISSHSSRITLLVM